MRLAQFIGVVSLWVVCSHSNAIAQGAYPRTRDAPEVGVERIIDKALELFEQKHYAQAAGLLEFVSAERGYLDYHPEALYWLAQIEIAQGNFVAAQGYLYTVYDQFPHSARYEEALYHHARLNYYSGNYHAALRELDGFRVAFPRSNSIGNSLYWSGLTLLTLGRSQEAAAMFERVVHGYPSSYRVDAAHYQLSLLQRAQRENSLLEIVRWTHEEYLSLLQETERVANETDQVLITTELQEAQIDEEPQLLREYRRQVERLRLELDNIKRLEVSDIERGVSGTALSVEERAQTLLELREEFRRTREEILLRLGEEEVDPLER